MSIPARSPVREVAATLTAAAAAAAEWHAIVVGAGPAGAATAIRLARGGRRVLLVDRGRMPRPKVCGACLSPRGVTELEALIAGADRAGDEWHDVVRLDVVRLVAAGRWSTIPMSGGVVWSREALDTMLVRTAIAAGVAWLPETAVSGITVTSGAGVGGTVPRGIAADHTGADHVAVSLAAATRASAGTHSKHVVHAAVAIIATGLADTIRIDDGAGAGGRSRHDNATRRTMTPHRGGTVRSGSRIGLGVVLEAAPPAAGSAAAMIGPPPSGELVMAVGRGGYCGIVRLEDGRLDVAAAVDRRIVAEAGSPAEGIARILATATAAGRDKKRVAARVSARRDLDHTARDDAAFAPELVDAALVDPMLIAAVRSAAVRATPPLTRTAPLVSGSGHVFRVGDAAGYVEPFTGEGMGWALTAARVLADLLLDHASPATSYPRAHAAAFSRQHDRVWRVARGVRHPAVAAAAVRLAAAVPRVAACVLPFVTGSAARRTNGASR